VVASGGGARATVRVERAGGAVKLDEFVLDRYWRYALPLAYAGCAASVAWGVALAVFELADAPVVIDIVLLVGACALNVGSLLTARLLGEHDEPGPDRSVLAWIWQSLLVGAVLLAAFRWRELWAEGLDADDHPSLLLQHGDHDGAAAPPVAHDADGGVDGEGVGWSLGPERGSGPEVEGPDGFR
jgi:hypothetical protein